MSDLNKRPVNQSLTAVISKLEKDVAELKRRSIQLTELAAKPEYVNYFPSNPVDGQEIYYIKDATNLIIWHLRWTSQNNRWVFLGGPPISDGPQGSVTTSSTSSVGSAFSSGPLISLTRGHYDVIYGAEVGITTGPPSNADTGLLLYDSFNVVQTAYIVMLNQYERHSVSINSTFVEPTSTRNYTVRLTNNQGRTIYGQKAYISAIPRFLY